MYLIPGYYTKKARFYMDKLTISISHVNFIRYLLKVLNDYPYKKTLFDC